MEGDRRGALKRRPGTQFKKKGVNRKGNWGSVGQDYHENTQIPNPADTVYRILCPSRKIGGVIGKGGGIIKNLREDTKSKITVSDTIMGSDERVIMIYSPPDKISKVELDVEKLDESMLPHCPAQDALMRVHERIIEEDLLGGSKDDEDSDTVIAARLLVPSNMVGCLLGKGGDVIRRLRSETGANIRVLPAEHLPACALSTDELVEIQGNPMVLKKALYEVSTLLHENPRKENALNVAMPLRGSGFHPAGPPMNNMLPPRNPMWSPRNRSSHFPPPPWMDDHAHPGFMPGGFDDGLTGPDVECAGEFSMKILCLTSKIGGVIGKGGSNVRQLQEETGTSIHVEEASASSEERVVRVSAFEMLRNPRSQTIDAILLLQIKASEVSDKGIITTRLLLPSNKVGCLLGQGGSVINEMRRRTQADIRINSKDDKPECASEDEELVQVSGSFAVAKDALAEIASRLRVRCLKDASVTAEQLPARPVPEYGHPVQEYGHPVQEYGHPVQEYGHPVQEYGHPVQEYSYPAQEYSHSGSFARGGPPVPRPIGVGSPGGYGGYGAVKGRLHDHEPLSYPVHPSGSRYPSSNSSVEAHLPNSTVSSIPGAGGLYSSAHEAPRTGLKLQNPYPIHSESMADKRGPDHINAAPGMHYSYSGQNNSHQGYSYPNGPASYQSMAPQQAQYQTPYQNPTSHQIPYQQNNAQQSSYPNVNAQHTAYQSTPTHGGYQI